MIGYGAQADRILINQSIHNAVLYSSLSGSLLAGLLIIFIYVYVSILLLKFYFTGAYKLCNSSLVHFAASILIIICLRSILETSFAIFSIDFLVFIIGFLFFKESLKNIKNFNIPMLKIYYWANNIKSNTEKVFLF